MVTVRQIPVNDEVAIEGMPQKQTPLTFKFAVQKILSLCNMIAMHHPKGRVMVIIQSPDYREGIGAGKPSSQVCLDKSGEIDVLTDSLWQDNVGGNGGKAGFGTEANVFEPASMAFSDIRSVREDEHGQQGKQPLTKREKETLDLIACGKTNKDIAYIFGISEQTVKCHVGSILRKLHASDRAHSVALALRNGFI
jgi:DNA-binding NarL/FixJ family response regulator